MSSYFVLRTDQDILESDRRAAHEEVVMKKFNHFFILEPIKSDRTRIGPEASSNRICAGIEIEDHGMQIENYDDGAGDDASHKANEINEKTNESDTSTAPNSRYANNVTASETSMHRMKRCTSGLSTICTKILEILPL